MRTLILTAFALTLGVGACNEQNKDQPTQNTQPPPAAVSTAAPAATPTVTQAAKTADVPAQKPTVEFKIESVANTMAFNITTFTVSAGQPVHLVFHNNSTMKLLPHNWVLVKPGTEASVAAAGLQKGEAGNYLDTTSSDVLAYSPLAAMGATVETTFNAPTQPGTYPYICTVVGHYMKMKGTLVVTP